MQYHLNGYTFGDPRIQPELEGGAPSYDELPETCDVLIVGTGPAGAVAAAQLARFPEVDVRVIERRQAPLLRGHADGVAVRTVETFQTFGLADTLLNEALWINETAFYSDDVEGSDVQGIQRTGVTQDVADGLSEYPHVIVNQARMCELLFDDAAKQPRRLEVNYGYHFLDQTIDAEGNAEYPVVVTLAETDENNQPTETTRTLRAKYVIGCDGARSAVRASIGAELHGDAQNHAWGVVDGLVDTDYPDIRRKGIISSQHGSIVLIPREGGHLVRLYVDLGTVPDDDPTFRSSVTIEQVCEKAQAIMAPYHLEVRSVAWWSVYEVGQRLTNAFDNGENPRIFIAGDACHTHSAKAGQGMNVSMQDTFNLGWKLAAVLTGRAEPALLETYSAERQVTAKQLIDYDTKWSKMVGSRGSEEESTASEVQTQFVDGGVFTAGLATHYQPSFSELTTAGEHQELATGFPIGQRFHSTPVIRVADAQPLQLGHVHEADGRWRIYLFADETGIGPDSAVGAWCETMSTDENSAIRRFTRPDASTDELFDVHAITQQHHLDVDWNQVPALLQPRVGDFQVKDLHKVHAAEVTNGYLFGNIPGLTATQDAYQARSVDKTRGAVVVVRPDQYVADVLPLDAYDEFNAYFDRFLTPHEA